MSPALLWVMLGFCIALSLAVLILVILLYTKTVSRNELNRLQQILSGEMRTMRGELAADQQLAIRTVGEHLLHTQQQNAAAQDQRLRAMQSTLSEQFGLIDARLDSANRLTEQKLENIRQSMETRLGTMQQENTRLKGNS